MMLKKNTLMKKMKHMNNNDRNMKESDYEEDTENENFEDEKIFSGEYWEDE